MSDPNVIARSLRRPKEVEGDEAISTFNIEIASSDESPFGRFVLLAMTVRTLTIFFILHASSSIFAQERTETSQFGAYLHGGLNIHSANFQTLPGVPSCCPRYENGSGAGFSAGGFYDFFSASPLSFQIRLGYSMLSATLKTDEYTTVLINGNSAQGAFEHSVQASIGMLGFSPLAVYHITPNAAVLAGPTLGWIPSNNFSERETMIEPTNTGAFDSSGARIRNAYSGATPGASKFYVGVTAGAQYRLPLNTSETLFALPEVFGTYGLTPLVRGMNWRASSIAAGVSFEYRMFEPVPSPAPPPLPPPIPPSPPAKPKLPLLTAHLAVATLDSLQNERPLKELVIEDYIRTQYRPLLNYIFFDSASAQLPERYHTLTRTETSSFDYKALNDYETLPLYYEVLNIIGERMRMYPHGTLRLVGCSGDADTRTTAIARGRAEALFHYLHEAWNIDSTRMKIEVRALPEKPSNVQDSDGQAENRRAEIYSNLPQILEPIFTTDTAHIPKPGIIRFLPSGVAETGWSHWAIPTSEGPVKLKDFSGKGTLASHLDWELDKERETSLATLDTIRAVLDVTDRAGQEVESNEVAVPVRHYTLLDKHRVGSADTIISRYSLILFDFDRSDLGNDNRRIAEFVKERISGTSDVRILGYTDRMGTDEYNQTLSAQRARSTERYIGIHNADVRGLGRSVLLYNNALPEGRFYSRTVTVVVTTPYGAAGK